MKKSTLEDIYLSLPVFAQNALISIKGYQLNKVRNRGDHHKYKQEIQKRRSWSEDQHNNYQLNELNRLIKFAIDNTAYYNKLLTKDFEPLTQIKDIHKIPLLEKKQILKNRNAFISKSMDSHEQITVHTTGTTGSPLEVPCTPKSRQLNYAFFDDFLSSIGIDTEKPHIIIGGRIIMPPASLSPPFWRYSAFQKSLLMSSYHLSDDTLNHYVSKIKSFNPEYIESYPSSIYRIATYILHKKIKLSCKAIVTSAESLSQEQREVIELAFNCKIFDQYGSAEMCVFAAQCTEGAYHVRPDYSLLEIVDDNGTPVLDGASGNVVCTGFINELFPLIRYSIGDVAAFGPPCNCGLKTPTLKEINGRKDDVIKTADGRQIGRLSPVLKGFPIIASQYIQHTLNNIELHIIPAEGFTNDMLIPIESALRKRLGNNIEIDITIVDSIATGPGGKLRSVISYVN